MVDPPLVLAPMAGVTNHAFRLMCKRAGGCGLVSTEMFSAYAIKFRAPLPGWLPGWRFPNRHPGSHPGTGADSMIDWTDDERPVAAQVFAGDPETVAIGARALQEAGADIVDVNLGCPVPKVAKSGSGAALLKDLGLAREILIAARGALSVPLTVKTRLGWKPGEITVLDLARIAEVCGVDAITVHGRFAMQGYSGKANWDIIAEVKRSVGIPVIANGDIATPEDAARAFETTGCDGIMIGRAALGDPWVFRRISHYLATGKRLPEPTIMQRLDGARQHAALLRELLGEKRSAKEMRGHLVHYIKGLPGAAALRNRLMMTRSVDEITEVLDETRREC